MVLCDRESVYRNAEAAWRKGARSTQGRPPKSCAESRTGPWPVVITNDSSWTCPNSAPECYSRMLLMLRVVLLLVDPLALAILLTIDLAPFLRRERSTVSLALGLDFVMNRGFLLL
jgi:hypothetical protein